MHAHKFNVTKVVLNVEPGSPHDTKPSIVKFAGKITASGKGTIKYLFARSDNTLGPLQTLDFEEAGTKEVNTSWALHEPGLASYAGWLMLRVVFPTDMESEKASFSVSSGEHQEAVGSEEEPVVIMPPREKAPGSENASAVAVERIVSTTPDVRTIWEFMEAYASDPHRARLLQQSFAVGMLGSGCSGAMISPHIFMTAGHCGGAGWTGSVVFIRIDEDSSTPGATAQVYDRYYARALPWYESYEEVRPLGGGDTQLWWVEEGPDGIPPGIKYGYLELSPTAVRIGEKAYSFWVNPVENFRGSRLDWTTLFSSGDATNRYVSDWRGPTTTYSMYGAGGSSGSPVLSAASSQVIGITSAAFGGGGVFRDIADTDHFLRQSDADRNNVLDAVESDWVMTQPLESFYHFWFNTPLKQALWMKNPVAGRGSFTTEAGPWTAKVEGLRSGQENDGLWRRTAKFVPNATYRISVAARGVSAGQTSYIRFWSDTAGAGSDRIWRFAPDGTWRRFTGRVTLGNNPHYRLILGTDSTTAVYIQDLTLVREDNTMLNFETGSDRAAWECIGGSYITPWGMNGSNDFSGVVTGPSPTPPGWGLRNRYVAFRPNQTYELSFMVKHIAGPVNVASAHVNIQTLGGASAFRNTWAFTTVGEQRQLSYRFAIPHEMGYTLTFGSSGSVGYMIDNINIREVA
jgi:V8-like Glu-specific endopeptidase